MSVLWRCTRCGIEQDTPDHCCAYCGMACYEFSATDLRWLKGKHIAPMTHEEIEAVRLQDEQRKPHLESD